MTYSFKKQNFILCFSVTRRDTLVQQLRNLYTIKFKNKINKMSKIISVLR